MRRPTHVRSADGHVPSNRRRRWLAWIFAVIFGTATAHAGDVPFSYQGPIATEFDAYRIELADIDGDGDLDTVATNGLLETFAWFENTATDGSAWTQHTIGTTISAFAHSVFPVDLDNDGDLDVIASEAFWDANPNGLTWFENTSGDGSTWQRHSIATGSQQRIFAADIDGDGDLDVLAVDESNDRVNWFENTAGDASAWSPHLITDIGEPEIAVTADFDGDGDLDVLMGFDSIYDVQLFENTSGDGSTWQRHTVAEHPDYYYGALYTALTPGDIDGDGDLDVAASCRVCQGDRTAWHENVAGDGSVWSAHYISNQGANGDMRVADIDGDGDLDMAGSIGFFTLGWWDNLEGDGSAWTARALPVPDQSFYYWDVADVDGDGDFDVVAESRFGDRIDFYRNDTIHRNATFPELDFIQFALEPTGTPFIAADFDRDGDLDLATGEGSPPPNFVFWLENTAGDGSDWTRRPIATAQVPFAMSAGDIDSDGDADFLYVLRSNLIAWYENTGGDGSTWTGHTISTTTNDPFSIASADLDSDGDLDALTVSNDDDTVVWFENTAGDGSVWTQHTISSLVANASNAVAGDVDRDGDLDVVSTGANSDDVTWHENVNGDGMTWSQHTIGTIANAVRLSVVDVDGDGDLDAISAGFNNSEMSWFENTAGDGSTWSKHTISTDPDSNSGLASSDLDNDGDLDILTSSFFSDELAWHENAVGDGSTWIKHVIAELDQAQHAIAADIDGDGDDDGLVTLYDSGIKPLAWFANQGGQFGLPTTNLATGFLNEGDTDAVLRTDLVHHGRVGDSDVELTSIAVQLTDTTEAPLTSAQANALIDTFAVYLDDGSGSFEPGSDTEVASLTDLTLDNGVMSFTFADGDPDVTTTVGNDKTYFIVATWTADASTAVPNEIVISHLIKGPPTSTADDASADIPLALEGVAADRGTIQIEIVDGDQIFQDGFERGDTSAWSSAVPDEE